MPELPEVETVRRLLDHSLVGKTIDLARFSDDPIVFEGRNPDDLKLAIEGQTAQSTGRKGKILWMSFEPGTTLFIHLGMSGWIRALNDPSDKRLLNHGKAPLDDESGVPRFMKFFLMANDGARIAFTDGRRLGRVWLGKEPENDRRILKLGPDALDSPLTAESLESRLRNRTGPIKSWLMDQSNLSGVGNWVADEVLYQARIAPKRAAGSLSSRELETLCRTLSEVLALAVEVGADDNRYPENWMFHHRWGGSKGAEFLEGRKIVRESIGGRTTAWIPDWQS